MESAIEEKSHRLGEQIYFLRGFMVFMAIHFGLNFLASPLVTYSGALLAITAFLAVQFLRWDQGFYIAMLYTLVGGQVKVIWGYNPFFRFIPDILLIVLIFRSFVSKGKLFNFERTPNIYIWMLLGHFLWFVVGLFNPAGAGFIPSLASGKFYILPIFFFFTLLNFEFDSTSRLFKDFLKTYMFFVIVEAILVIYQSTQGPEWIYSISPYYRNLFEKFQMFDTARTFRPWGTASVPGGYASFFFLSSGFIFLWSIQPGGDDAQKLSSSKKLFLFVFTVLSLFGVLISQVRSSFIKEIGVITLGLFFSLLGTRFVAKRILGIGLGILAFLAVSFYGLQNSKGLGEFMTMEKVVARYEAIGSVEKASSQRVSFSSGLGAIGRRLSIPFGLGLGMGTTYLDAYSQKRAENVDVDQSLYWTLDNFFVHVSTEMGFGSLFLILMVLTTPLILASFMITALRRKNYEVYRTICYCFVSVVAITVGQWGAIGIMYPPEFQYYWFYVALALSSFYKAYPKQIGAVPIK